MRRRTWRDRLTGKVAFITGAARGRAALTPSGWASEGADIILSDNFALSDSAFDAMSALDELEQTVKAVEALGRRVMAAGSTSVIWPRMCALADGAAELGRIDIVVGNAAILVWSEDARARPQWQDVIDVNLTGVWKTVKATVPHVQAGGRGGSVILTKLHGRRAGTARGPGSLRRVQSWRGDADEDPGHGARTGEHPRANTVHPPGTVLSGMVLNLDMVYRRFRPDLEHPEPGRTSRKP